MQSIFKLFFDCDEFVLHEQFEMVCLFWCCSNSNEKYLNGCCEHFLSIIRVLYFLHDKDASEGVWFSFLSIEITSRLLASLSSPTCMWMFVRVGIMGQFPGCYLILIPHFIGLDLSVSFVSFMPDTFSRFLVFSCHRCAELNYLYLQISWFGREVLE